MSTPAIIGVLLTVVGILCIAVLLRALIRRRRRRSRDRAADICPRCHQPVPRGATTCPTCGKTPAGPSPPSAASDRPLPALIGLSGTLEREVFTIHSAPQGLTIGRNPDNDVVISDMLAVSRYHAQVMPEDNGFVLYDRNSANGTAVNNQRVFRHQLQDGDRIQICGAQFVFSQTGRMPSRAPTPVNLPALNENLIFGPDTPYEGYVLEELLGEGGMSVVYRGHDPEGNVVAIKILNVTDEYVVRKFIQEHQIGEVLRSHPYIREVHRLGRSQQRNLYLVMEYIDGYSLRRRIGTLSDDETIRVVGQSCTALAYAHERQIVHRDIKPENILITREGNIKITDFGIAKLTSSVTVTSDRVVGTPEYMSPEQARGGQSIKPSSDIYSMGIVLYQLLTGRVPFPLPKTDDPFRAAVTVLRQHVNTPPPLPREQNPRVPPRLEKVALCALEKDPRKRYPTALAMRQALGHEEETILETHEQEPVPKFCLVVTQGTRGGHRIVVDADSITIGRADLDPGDSHISRRHATISPRGSQLWLQDTSLNGTSINGQRVYGEALLHLGDKIEIGNSVLSMTPYS